MREILHSFGFCLALTVIIETAVAFSMRVRGKDLLLLLLVNILTNPLAVYINMVFGYYAGFCFLFWQIPLEIGVFLGEGLLLKGFSENIKRPFTVSLVINLCSYLTGVLISII